MILSLPKRIVIRYIGLIEHEVRIFSRWQHMNAPV